MYVFASLTQVRACLLTKMVYIIDGFFFFFRAETSFGKSKRGALYIRQDCGFYYLGGQDTCFRVVYESEKRVVFYGEKQSPSPGYMRCRGRENMGGGVCASFVCLFEML